jgi:hypothetical protein
MAEAIVAASAPRLAVTSARRDIGILGSLLPVDASYKRDGGMVSVPMVDPPFCQPRPMSQPVDHPDREVWASQFRTRAGP